MLADLFADPDQLLAVEIAPSMTLLWLRICARARAVASLLGCIAQLLELGLHIILRAGSAELGTRQSIEHRRKRELHLCRVDRFGLLAEELPFQALQLVEHERVELA